MNWESSNIAQCNSTPVPSIIGDSKLQTTHAYCAMTCYPLEAERTAGVLYGHRYWCWISWQLALSPRAVKCMMSWTKGSHVSHMT